MTVEQEYRAQFRAEGRAEALTELLLELLTQKFGELPASVTTTVHNGSASDLKTWGSQILTAATLADMFPPEPGGAS